MREVPGFPTIDELREQIDDFKKGRLANPWKKHAFDTISAGSCIEFFIEQIGDAELYQEAWLNRQKETDG